MTIIKGVLVIFLCFSLSCVAREAFKADIQGVRNDVGALEKIVEQKADNSVVADQIDTVNNKIEQTSQVAGELSVWRDKIIKAETINYGGGGWIVAGTGVIAFIFVGAGVLLVRAFIKRSNLLNLVTCAVQKVAKEHPSMQQALSTQLDKEVNNGGKFRAQDKEALARFCRKMGTFFKNA